MADEVSLSIDELDNLIVQICAGRKIVHISNSNDEMVPVLLVTPDAKYMLLANHIYNVYYRKAKDDGFLNIDEMKEELKKRGIYTDEDNKKIEELEDQVSLIKKKKFKFRNQKKLLKQLDAKADKLYDEVYEIRAKLNDKLGMTCESRAAEEKLVYLTFVCSLDPFTEQPIWGTWEEFNEGVDSMFRAGVIKEFGEFSSGLRIKTVRYIARSPLWRVRYLAAVKTGDNLFSVPVSDYNVNQLNLIYWSNFYSSLHEMMPDEIPPDDIIEDDEALDEYMTMIREERDEDIRERRQEKLGRFSKRGAFAHDEVIVTAQDPSFRDYEYSTVKKPKEEDVTDVIEKSLKTRQKIKDKLRKGK